MDANQLGLLIKIFRAQNNARESHKSGIPSVTRIQRPALFVTDIPGVYRNRSGVFCNEKGVSLSFAELKEADAERWVEVLGHAPTSPAELLKGIALDPRAPFDVRMKAAQQAAPYYDMRMPLRIDGNVKTNTGLDMAALAKMSKEKRESLLKLLREAGVEL